MLEFFIFYFCICICSLTPWPTSMTCALTLTNSRAQYSRHSEMSCCTESYRILPFSSVWRADSPYFLLSHSQGRVHHPFFIFQHHTQHVCSYHFEHSRGWCHDDCIRSLVRIIRVMLPVCRPRQKKTFTASSDVVTRGRQKKVFIWIF